MTGEFRISLFFLVTLSLSHWVKHQHPRLVRATLLCTRGGLLVTVGGSYNVIARTDARE